jgi:hypothetical protein
MTGSVEDIVKAYHEAGHVIVARVLGVEITLVTMFSTYQTNQSVAQSRSAAWLARAADLKTRLSAIEIDIKVCLGGPAAQNRHRPRRNARKNPPEWASDVARATSGVANWVMLKTGQLPTSGSFTLDREQAAIAVALFKRLNGETNDLVAEKWAAVERIAEALLSRRILVQDDVDALIFGGLR